jgi:hypothetical protein
MNKGKTGWGKILHEIKKYWLYVLYMSVFFSVFTNYRRLLMAHYQISYEDYGVSVIKALVLAKVVLVAESLGLGRGFRDKPLIIPTLYKTFLFTVCVAIFSIIESMIRSIIQGRSSMETIAELMSKFNYIWLADGIVVFFSFIPFFAVRELSQVFGEETLSKLFFHRRSAVETGLDRPQNTPRE